MIKPRWMVELERRLAEADGGSGLQVVVGAGESEKAIAALEGFFAGTDVELDGKRVPRYRSFREAYVQLTGDEHVTGQLPLHAAGKLGLSRQNGGRVQVPVVEAVEEDGRIGLQLVEALSTTGWPEIFGDSVTRQMLREYRRSPYNAWRLIADAVPIKDFRVQRRERFGGYGDLPTVAQGAPYVAITSPTDEEATYSPAKRGGTETITLEGIANDDVGAIRRIPQRLAQAAARTLYTFVFDFLRTNPTIYDGVAFFHATHANLLSTGLSAASLLSARKTLFEQTDMSTEQIGLAARNLFVPVELEQIAYELTVSDRKPGTADNDANFIGSLGIQPVTVLDFTDENDWVLTADKADTPIIEVGFFGSEEPELFTQDNPNVGSMFTNDQLTWKLRHVYGGAVTDYRGAVKSQVA